jgi:hypothetical protein
MEPLPKANDRPSRANVPTTIPPVDWTAYQPPPFQRVFLADSPSSAANDHSSDGAVEGDDNGLDEWCGIAALPSVAQAFLSSPGGASYQQPTECQRKLWPALMSGCDALCVAPTGSGKTLAFMVPALVVAAAAASRWKEAQVARTAVAQQKRGPTSLGGAGRAGAAGFSSARSTLRFQGYSHDPGSPVRPAVLVLAPTRELAQQIAKVSRGIAELQFEHPSLYIQRN